MRGLVRKNNEFMQQLEKQALEEYIPVIQPEVVQLLRVILKSAGVKNLLEIGTAIGYSALVFSDILPDDGKVTTIELKEDVAEIAVENIKKANREDKITVICGNALEVLDTLKGGYDCIFMDGAKGQYNNFLPKCLKLLKNGGLLISDNVLYRGSVAEEGFIQRKHRTIIRNLKDFLYDISNRENLETTILPIGDGVAVTLKKDD